MFLQFLRSCISKFPEFSCSCIPCIPFFTTNEKASLSLHLISKLFYVIDCKSQQKNGEHELYKTKICLNLLNSILYVSFLKPFTNHGIKSLLHSHIKANSINSDFKIAEASSWIPEAPSWLIPRINKQNHSLFRQFQGWGKEEIKLVT